MKDISKKIGILTFSDIANKNYGALLQTYALKKVLQKFGYEPEIINYKKKFNGTLFDQLKYYIKNPFIKRKMEERPFARFAAEYIPERTNRISSTKLHDLNTKYSTFIVGSDQVWRHKYTKRDGLTFFLDFVNSDKKKIAYAASFGKDTLEVKDHELRKKIFELLKQFSAVSVREQSGVNICGQEFGMKAELVIDPTFLLTVDDYRKITDCLNFKENESYIASMVLDRSPSANKICNFISDKSGKKLINIAGNEGTFIKKYNLFEMWLKYIEHSDLVITDSFHCTVFAILFNKQFYVIKNKERGLSRIENLLRLMGINHNLILETGDEYYQLRPEKIDYNSVNRKRQLWRQKSLSYLELVIEDKIKTDRVSYDQKLQKPLYF